MRSSLITFLCTLAVALSTFTVHSQINFHRADSCWADSVMKTLSLDEKIGQLIFARANKDNQFLPEIPEQLKKYNLGGLVFFKSTPVRLAKAINHYKTLARTPLFYTMDAERGLAMRLDSTIGFPYMMTAGAVENDSLVYAMAAAIGRQCRRIGIQINFAPVADINSNPSNPVINMRSFGEDKFNVTRKSIAYIQGMRSQNVMGTFKHFPGHGDTDTDSHHTLPVVSQHFNQIDSVNLLPYKTMIKQGLEGVMVAHLFVPAIDNDPKNATSLSEKTIHELLRKKLGFQGLIFTDALEMKGVTNYHKPGDIEVKALMAGNDVLLMPVDIPLAIKKIRLAVDSCVIWPEDIDEKCMKILQFKHALGLENEKPVNLNHLIEDINPDQNQVIQRKIFREAMTLVKNEGDLLPVKISDSTRAAVIVTGSGNDHELIRDIQCYVPVTTINLAANTNERQNDSLLQELRHFNLVIFAQTNTSILPEKNFGLTTIGLEFLKCAAEQQPIILALFGNPYTLTRLERLDEIPAVICAYQDNPDTWSLCAQAIFGAISIDGTLPVSVKPELPVTTGIKIRANDRLSYPIAAETSLNPALLAKIDSVCMEGIREKAYPGCEVLFAWKGRVVYQKAFGKTGISDNVPVKIDDVYDLASVTKIAATTLAIMKLTEEKKINLDATLGTYLLWLKGSNKQSLVIRDVMTHQAKLSPWIPFYKHTLKNNHPDTTIYAKYWSPEFQLHVADSLYLNNSYRDSIFQWIAKSPLEKTTEYKYSDQGFILLKEVIEKVTGQSIEYYLNQNFYRPLGLSTLGYRPMTRLPLNRIAPTEWDTSFRHQLIHGYVHDPAAAMLGGVAGHAGLFSDANDLAILMQMLMNGGEYAGTRYLKPETVKEFTSVQFPWNNNRRGLGFDRPTQEYTEDGPACRSASQRSFGHSGFTGTYVWADPDQELVYIFLSNRVNPNAGNNKLAKMNIRTRIHELFYEAIRHQQNP